MSTRLTNALTSCLDAQALNDEQALLIFNPSDEIDSALEMAHALHQYAVPTEVISQMMDLLARAYRSNNAEREAQREAAGQVEHVLRAGRVRSITVKSLARAIRPLLADIDAHGPRTARGMMARRALHKLCRENPEALTAASLRHELRDSAYTRLQDELQVSA